MGTKPTKRTSWAVYTVAVRVARTCFYDHYVMARTAKEAQSKTDEAMLSNGVESFDFVDEVTDYMGIEHAVRMKEPAGSTLLRHYRKRQGGNVSAVGPLLLLAAFLLLLLLFFLPGLRDLPRPSCAVLEQRIVAYENCWQMTNACTLTPSDAALYQQALAERDSRCPEEEGIP